MVSSKKPPSAPDAPSAGRRRRRPAPTIDLAATEIGQSGSAPDASPAEDAPNQTQSGPATGVERPESATAAGPERPSSAGFAASWEHVRAWLPAKPAWSHLVAGSIGGGIVGTIVFLLWFAGPVPVGSGDGTAMRDRLTLLETQLRDLQNRQAPPGVVDAKGNDETIRRIAQLEQTMSRTVSLESSLPGRIDAIENSLKALGVALAALNQRSDEAAAAAADAARRADAAVKSVGELQASPAAGVEKADLEGLEKRVSALEGAIKAIEQAVGKPAVSTDPAVRLAVTLETLRMMVAAGEPFAPLLDLARSLGADAQQFAALAPFASTGIPTEAGLARELGALVPALIKSSNREAAGDGTFLQRLQANAGRLVRIRPINAPQGDDESAIVARIEFKAERSDLAGALTELNALSPSSRAPAEPWIEKVEARWTALDASRKLAADAFRALANRTP